MTSEAERDELEKEIAAVVRPHVRQAYEQGFKDGAASRPRTVSTADDLDAPRVGAMILLVRREQAEADAQIVDRIRRSYRPGNEVQRRVLWRAADAIRASVEGGNDANNQ